MIRGITSDVVCCGCGRAGKATIYLVDKDDPNKAKAALPDGWKFVQAAGARRPACSECAKERSG